MGITDKNLLFYKIMKYPVPTESDLFLFEKKIDKEPEISHKDQEFSRDKKNNFMDKFIKKINKHWDLYKSLPFIKEIYLCNSITFNALKRNSDIDLFIVVKKWHMWRARFFSAIFFKLNGLKRSMTDKKQKFCLSFYITEDNQNLYPIIIDKTDVYLSYRLSHLVPLYTQETKKTTKDSYNHNIYQNNKRLECLMPNHPQEHCISIWNNHFIWNTKVKKRLEFLFWWFVWNLIELLIKIIRLPILLYKTKKLWTKWNQIIISDKMLKFHDDIRKQIQLIYQIARKN